MTAKGLCYFTGAFLQIILRVGMWIFWYVYMYMWGITGEEKGKLHIYLYPISSIFLVLCNEIWAVVSDKGNEQGEKRTVLLSSRSPEFVSERYHGVLCFHGYNYRRKRNDIKSYTEVLVRSSCSCQLGAEAGAQVEEDHG